MHMIMWKWRRMKQQYGLWFAIFARHVRLIDLLTFKKKVNHKKQMNALMRTNKPHNR